MGIYETSTTKTVPGSGARLKNPSVKEGNSSRDGSLIKSLETPVKKIEKYSIFQNTVDKEIPKSSLTKRHTTEWLM